MPYMATAGSIALEKVVWLPDQKGLGYAIYGHCRIYSIGKGRLAARSIATAYYNRLACFQLRGTW